jgi:hypothetical protein
MTDLIAKARRYLNWRKTSYQAVFDINNRAAKLVLADLAKFCRANESTGHPNPHVAARLDGRREVYLRITQHLHLSIDELYHLYGGSQESQNE